MKEVFLVPFFSCVSRFVMSRYSLPYSSLVSTWKPLTRTSLKLRRVLVDSGYNKASSMIKVVPIGSIIVVLPEPIIQASRPTMVVRLPAFFAKRLEEFRLPQDGICCAAIS